MRVVFIHGKESGPNGVKIQAMSATVKALGYDVVAPDLRQHDDPQWRTQQLLAVLGNEPAYLVGSSLGGYVAANAAALAPELVRGLFLLCPAFDLPGYPLKRPEQPLRGHQVYFIHGQQDVVVPLQHSERAAQAWSSTLVTVEDDHPLHHSVDLICQHLSIWLTRQEQSA